MQGAQRKMPLTARDGAQSGKDPQQVRSNSIMEYTCFLPAQPFLPQCQNSESAIAMLPMLPCIFESLSDVNIAYALRRFVSKKSYRTTRRLATTTWLRRVRDFPLLLHPAAEAWLGRRHPTRFDFPDNHMTCLLMSTPFPQKC